MPWKTSDVSRHNKSAKTAKQRRMFTHVANAVLKKTGSESRAIKAANSVLKRTRRKKSRTSSVRK
jgi:hypothetical protein